FLLSSPADSTVDRCAIAASRTHPPHRPIDFPKRTAAMRATRMFHLPRLSNRPGARLWLATTCLAAASFVLLVLARPLHAQEAAPHAATESPYFFVKSDDPALDRLPLKGTEVEVKVTGVIADVTVTQHYRNEGSRPIEAR